MSALTEAEDNGPIAFFRRLKIGVAESVAKAVPGTVKLTLSPKDDGNSINTMSSNVKLCKTTTTTAFKLSQYEKLLIQDHVDLQRLRTISWNGIPAQYRTEVWQMLLGYMPLSKERRTAALMRKRKEYLDSVPLYFKSNGQDDDGGDRTTQEGEILRQIQVDLPRTSPNTPFFHQAQVQQAMERILYIWAIRHPASGYVQGMNDLLTPLLLNAIGPFTADPLRCDVATLDPSILVSQPRCALVQPPL